MSASTHARGIAFLAALALLPLGFLEPAIAAASSHAATLRVGGLAVRTIDAAPRLPRGTSLLGALSPEASVTGAVAMQPSNPHALAAFIGSVTDRNSTSFHHYLAPGEFASRFGPPSVAIGAVERALDAGGLHVTSVTSDGLLVRFQGTAAQVWATFRTGIDRYRFADGAVGTGTTGAVSLRLAASVARDVAGVIGLDDLVHPMPAGILRGAAAARSRFARATPSTFAKVSGAPSPCSSAQQTAQSSGGLTDDQIARAYGAFGLYGAGDVGQGQRIAVYELEAFSPSDIEVFDQCYFGATEAAQMSGTHGDISGSRLSLTPIDGGQATGPGSGESLLDIEDVAAMAPGANIDVYEAPDTSMGSLDEYATIINADTDKLVTSSWGLCEQLTQADEPGMQAAENVLFEQAASQGQTVLSAEGDTGSDSCNEYRYIEPPSGQNVLSVLDPASQPYVLSVGGTTIDDATQPPSEHVWNDGAEWGGAGGGISESWQMPAWQRDVALTAGNTTDVANAQALEVASAPAAAPTSTPTFCDGTLGLASGQPCRETPDVSAQADEFTGAATVYEQAGGGWFTVGGTSSATPIWAGLLALVNGSSACSSDLVNGVHDVGFASPLLYGIAASPAAYAASFNDVTSGNNDVFGLGGGLTFPARAGYDLASGLGSPRLTSASGGIGLSFYLCSYGAHAAPPVVTSVAPALGSVAGGEVVTVHGTGFGTAGAPAVASVQVGSAHATSFAVVDDTTLQATLPAAASTLPPGSPDPTQDGAGPAEIVVTLSSGASSASTASSRFEYVDETAGSVVATVTAVSPDAALDTSSGTVKVFGSGFSSVQRVDFGGVPATNVTVVSPYELTVTPPAFSSLSPAVACPVDDGAAGQPLDPLTDVCQVAVTVTESTGTSSTSAIHAPYEGPITFDGMGAEIVPSGCACEVEPQPSEFDYAPVPTVTSVSTGTVASLPENAPLLASLFGGAPSNTVTVTGTGLDPLTFNYGFYGTVSNEYGQFDPIQMSGSSMVIEAPQVDLIEGSAGVQPVSLPIGVTTVGGNSAPSAGDAIVYAGVPVLTAVVNASNHRTLDGLYGAPDTGGAPLTLEGSGLLQTAGPLVFDDAESPFSLGTQFQYAAVSDTRLSTTSLSLNPGIMVVSVCSNSGCSSPYMENDELMVYPPGAPTVAAVTPGTGRPTGYTQVDVKGANLGCAVGVSFGGQVVESGGNPQALLDCGATNDVLVNSPPGVAGTRVRVTVTTAESVLTGAGARSRADFTYTGRRGTPTITSLDTDTEETGKRFTFRFSATAIGAVTWRLTGQLPRGVAFSARPRGAAATIHGEPRGGVGGEYYLRVSAKNARGTSVQAFEFFVNQRPAIIAARAWTMTEGLPSRFVATTTGYPLATVAVQGSLPQGLGYVAGADGTITILGTAEPGSHGTYRVILVATSDAGSFGKALVIVVRRRTETR